MWLSIDHHKLLGVTVSRAGGSLVVQVLLVIVLLHGIVSVSTNALLRASRPHFMCRHHLQPLILLSVALAQQNSIVGVVPSISTFIALGPAFVDTLAHSDIWPV